MGPEKNSCVTVTSVSALSAPTTAVVPKMLSDRHRDFLFRVFGRAARQLTKRCCRCLTLSLSPTCFTFGNWLVSIVRTRGWVEGKFWACWVHVSKIAHFRISSGKISVRDRLGLYVPKYRLRVKNREKTKKFRILHEKKCLVTKNFGTKSFASENNRASQKKNSKSPKKCHFWPFSAKNYPALFGK